jgi:hypothetical protein
MKYAQVQRMQIKAVLFQVPFLVWYSGGRRQKDQIRKSDKRGDPPLIITELFILRTGWICGHVGEMGEQRRV